MSDSLESKIASFLSPDYPCTPALSALKQGSLIITEIPGKIGSTGIDLRPMLQGFIDRLESRNEPYLSLWLSWDPEEMSEEEFEIRLWREVRAFCPNLPVSFGSHQLFLVGMHPNSSRKARRFPRCSIIVNSFSQFERIEATGNYPSLVSSIRERDKKYSGSVNPMVEEYGDVWEEIQFSGKVNPPDWEPPT